MISRHARFVEREAKKRKLECVEVEKSVELEESQGQQTDTLEELKNKLGSISDKLSSTLKELECSQERLKIANMKVATIEDELRVVKSENTRLKKEFMLTEEAFEKNDQKVCFYTGLPTWDILQKLLKYIEPCFATTSRSLLSPFQQLLLTLMRLRLNLSGVDLGFRFNIHRSTVSRIFSQVIDILYYRLKPLIYWPDRDSQIQCQWIFESTVPTLLSSWHNHIQCINIIRRLSI